MDSNFLKRIGGLALALVFTGAALAGPKTPQEWPALTQMLQELLDKHRADFEALKEPLESQPPHRLKMGREGLMVRWSRDSEEWMPAPDTLAERVTPYFNKLGLMSVQYAPGYVQFMPRSMAHNFRGRAILILAVYSVTSEGAPKCTEELLMEQGREFGRCWLPMKPENWFIDFTWISEPT